MGIAWALPFRLDTEYRIAISSEAVRVIVSRGDSGDGAIEATASLPVIETR